MKGLLKSNYFATIVNAKVITVIMLSLCALSIVIKSQILLISFVLLSMIGFAVISLASIRKESNSKWGKYKLTLPIKRAAIVQSYYLSLVFWLLWGIFIAGIGIALSILLRGFLFDKNTDIINLYVAGIGISLFMGAIFFPLFHWQSGEERSEAFLAISLILGIGMMIGVSTVINALFTKPMTTLQTINADILILLWAILVFVFSCLLTIHIYRKRDY